MWVSFQSLCTELRAGGIRGQELPSPGCLDVIKPFFLRVVQEIKRERELCVEPPPPVKTPEEPVKIPTPTPSPSIPSRVPSVKEPEVEVKKGRLV